MRRKTIENAKERLKLSSSPLTVDEQSALIGYYENGFISKASDAKSDPLSVTVQVYFYPIDD
jgi:hypothetical protein